MRVHKLFAWFMLLACCLTFSNCAEFNRRGGTADYIEDIFFRADTKSHRLLRSYVLVGVLLAAAEQAGTTQAGKDAISSQLKSSLTVIREAYACLYPDGLLPGAADRVVKQYGGPGSPDVSREYLSPRWCQFFDEKMRRLDHSIFYLSMLTLFNEQNRGYLGDIQSRLVGKLPVISESVKAILAANRAVKDTTTLIDDLLNLSISSFGPASTLLPLYRDVVELNSWIIIDSLAVSCFHANSGTRDALAQVGAAEPAPVVIVAASPAPSEIPDVSADMGYTPIRSDLRYIASPDRACGDYRTALQLIERGHANPDALRVWINTHNLSNLKVEAYPTHFYVITKFVADSCSRIITQTGCRDIFRAVTGEGPGAVPADLDFNTRQVTAFLRPTTRYAARPARIPVASPRTTPDDPVSTGSVPRRR